MRSAWDGTKYIALRGPEAREEKRRAGHVAIAIDGLADRAKSELGINIDLVLVRNRRRETRRMPRSGTRCRE
jgi:hypothetical protein